MINFSNITIGNMQVSAVHFGNTQIWPGVSPPGITVNPTYIYVDTPMIDSGTIQVTASTSGWSATSSQSWLTVTKASDTELTWRCARNTQTLRSAIISFTINGVEYATCTVDQIGLIDMQ